MHNTRPRRAFIIVTHPACHVTPSLETITTAGKGVLIDTKAFPQGAFGSTVSAIPAMERKIDGLAKSDLVIISVDWDPFYHFDITMPRLRGRGFEVSLILLRPKKGHEQVADPSLIARFQDQMEHGSVRYFVEMCLKTKTLQIFETEREIGSTELDRTIMELLGIPVPTLAAA